MLFYVLYLSLFSVLCLVVSYFKRKKIKIELFNYITLCLLLIVSVFRFDVGYDYPSYYYTILHEDYVDINRYDFFSAFFAEISIYFKSPWLFFFLFASITYFLIFYSCYKYSVNPIFSFFIYFCVYYFDSLGIIRQALAVSIILYGFDYIRKRLFLRYLLFVIIASLFHKTAIISLFFYFIYKMNLKLMLVLSLLLLLMLNYIYYFLFENDIMKFYFTAYDNFSGGDKVKIFNIIVYFLLLFISKCNHTYKKAEGLFSLVFLGLVLPFTFGGHLGGRVSAYFLIFNIILIPVVLIKSNIYLKLTFIMLFVVYYIVFLYISQYSGRSGFIPYQFIFYIDGNNPVFRWKSPYVF